MCIRDSIRGDEGADRITGGSGNDSFLYTSITDSTSISHDTFTDFGSGDKFVLQISGTAGQSFSFLGANNFTSDTSKVEARQNNDGNLEIDVTGSGSLDMFVDIDNTVTLSASNFDFTATS